MCQARGFVLDWDERRYMQYALFSPTALQEAIYAHFPDLKKQEPNWSVLYAEKKQAYRELLKERGAGLMPGAELLLKELERAGIKRCVVTHSPSEQIAQIRLQNPILDSIPHWITREDYEKPKPSPECYQKAIALLKEPGDRIIGFEDSPRGLRALLGTEAEGVMVSDVFPQKELQDILEQLPRPAVHTPSLLEINEELLGIAHAHEK